MSESPATGLLPPAWVESWQGGRVELRFRGQELYASLLFTSPQDWVTLTMNLPEKVYSAFECQANEFAGRFLVPREELEWQTEEAIKTMQEANLESVLRKNPDMALSFITPPMRRYFGVSDDVIEKRIQREKLWPPKLP